MVGVVYVLANAKPLQRRSSHTAMRRKEMDANPGDMEAKNQVRNNSSKRPHGGGNGYDEARGAERLEANPFGAPLRDLLLNYIHFNWEINRQGPEPKGPEDPNDVIEEGEEHRDNGAEKVEFVRGIGAGDGDLDFGGDEFVVRVVLGCGFFDEGEEGLAVDLVGADEVDDDGGVGDVEEPEWVVEAEAG
nr:hypothetical protein VIGAN_02139000 [Ipomoea batatas]